MSRIIKFRVWLEKSKKMIYPSDNLYCIYDDGGCEQHYSLCLLQQLKENFYNNSPHYPDKYTDLSGEKILQQFTGLKDKNGREIYEGDIVKYSWLTHCNEANEDIGEVYFEDGIFYFDREMSFATNDGNFCKDSLEIIGNIYENPELLK